MGHCPIVCPPPTSRHFAINSTIITRLYSGPYLQWRTCTTSGHTVGFKDEASVPRYSPGERCPGLSRRDPDSLNRGRPGRTGRPGRHDCSGISIDKFKSHSSFSEKQKKFQASLIISRLIFGSLYLLSDWFPLSVLNLDESRKFSSRPKLKFSDRLHHWIGWLPRAFRTCTMHVVRIKDNNPIWWS
jgi:hypothetical protein